MTLLKVSSRCLYGVIRYRAYRYILACVAGDSRERVIFGVIQCNSPRGYATRVHGQLRHQNKGILASYPAYVEIFPCREARASF